MSRDLRQKRLMPDLLGPPDLRRLQLEEEVVGVEEGQEKVQTEKFGRRNFGAAGIRFRRLPERLHPDLRRPHPHRRRRQGSRRTSSSETIFSSGYSVTEIRNFAILGNIKIFPN